jgi:MbtH protein
MTTTNPFEDTDGRYLVLINNNGQHSLWRDFIAVPAGWRTTFGPAGRQDCLDHIDRTWADLRPAEPDPAVARLRS